MIGQIDAVVGASLPQSEVLQGYLATSLVQQFSSMELNHLIENKP